MNDYNPDLDESSLSLFDVDMNCSALQSALSADSVQIDLLPESPLLTDDELLALSINELTPAQRALHALDLHLSETKISHSEFYSAQQSVQGTSLRGHMDGGAQASTTDCLDYLFHYRSLPAKSATLKVADNTPHYPIGSGYLRVAAYTVSGYIMVPTFYTPTLPATIVSPSDLGSKLGCSSFTTFASLSDMECCLTLHHCQRHSQDIRIPLTVVRGLLYTADLQRPTPHEHESSFSVLSLQTHLLDCRCPCSLHDSSVDTSCDSLGDNGNTSICPLVPSCSLLDQVRTIQRLAFQTDVDYTMLHEHSDGVSVWPSSSLCVCSLSSSASASVNRLTRDQL